MTPYADGVYKVAMVAAGVAAILCACSSAKSADADYTPYTCVSPQLPAAPPTSAPDQPHRIAVISDSYTSGSPQGGTGTHRWTSDVTRALQDRGIRTVFDIGAEGGGGYVQGARNTGQVFADKVKATVKPDDQLLIFFGSRNDSKWTKGQFARATCDTLREARMAAPEAKLLVVGPAWQNGDPPAYLLQVRDMLSDRTAALGGTFVDPIADRWFVDRPDLIGADGVHPTDAGHVYMAQLLLPTIERMLAPQSAG